MTVITNTMQWANVGIPLVQGVNTGIRERLADPTTLTIANNVYYPKIGGPEKRLGYDYVNITNPLAIPTNSEEYTYGYGAGPLTSAPFLYANIGDIKNITERDTELVIQAEDCLFNANKKISDRFHCFSATTKNIAKTQNSQTFSEMADNGIIKVVAFRDLQNADVKIYCYDSVTGSLKFSASATPNDPEYIKVVPIGGYIHVYISNISDQTLYLHPIFPGAYSLSPVVDLGECDITFDVCKLNETHVLVAKRIIAGGITCGYVNPVGTTNASFASFNTAMDIGGASIVGLGVSIHPDTTVGLLWDQGATQRGRTYTLNLTTLGTVQTVFTDASCTKVTLVPRINVASSFYCFADGSDTVYTAHFDSVTSVPSYYIHNCHLAGKAFNIEAAAFVWVCRPSTLQTSYLILNFYGEVVGKLEYGTAVSNTSDAMMFSSNVIGRTVHGAINYKRNILNQPGVFHEISTKEYLLDFDFKPRPAQAGRCLYYPGAQMWCYDGERLTEQGFHFAVENPTLSPSNSTGSLTNNGEYYYLIYACHKNAQGEEVRGPAILSNAVTLGASDDTVTITADTIPTLHQDSYFLIYRNANTGTTWHLVSERDPFSSNCPKNDTTNATWTFIDTISDVALASRELDGFSTDNYLPPFSAPSCTIVSYGKDRLWLAGGEIPGSQVWPSRLFTQYDTPAFHPAISVDIDKSLDNVTAIGFVADYVVVFKRKKGYILFGDGLDNVLVGNQFQPQLSLTDVGAISPCVRSITGGLVFQSEGSYRIMEPGGKVVDIADPIKDYFGLCNGMNLDIENTSLELYQSNCTLVWNYALNIWTRWTSTCDAISECNYIGVGNKVYVQGDLYTDDGSIYEVRVKTAPFSQSVPGRDSSSQIGNFQRIRRVSGVGTGEGTFTVNTYLDEKEYPSDSFVISVPLVSSEWGDGTWGSGFWGDANGTDYVMADDRMRWRRRLSIQKCSCIAIEIVYNGMDKGPIHTAFIIEYGTKNGIDR